MRLTRAQPACIIQTEASEMQRRATENLKPLTEYGERTTENCTPLCFSDLLPGKRNSFLRTKVGYNSYEGNIRNVWKYATFSIKSLPNLHICIICLISSPYPSPTPSTGPIINQAAAKLLFPSQAIFRIRVWAALLAIGQHSINHRQLSFYPSSGCCCVNCCSWRSRTAQGEKRVNEKTLKNSNEICCTFSHLKLKRKLWRTEAFRLKCARR